MQQPSGSKQGGCGRRFEWLRWNSHGTVIPCRTLSTTASSPHHSCKLLPLLLLLLLQGGIVGWVASSSQVAAALEGAGAA